MQITAISPHLEKVIVLALVTIRLKATLTDAPLIVVPPAALESGPS